ncbi:ubiquitin carboxyl-terminal hydrolase 38-like isoform X2 [Babylonia areolata]
MDHILEGVLASSHPEAMKRQLIEKISEKGQDQQPSHDVQAVLHLAINWVLHGTSQLQVSSGFKLFRSWAQHHMAELENVLTRDLILNLISKPSRNQANLPLLLTQALNMLSEQENTKVFLQHLKVLGAKAGVFLKESPDIPSVKNYVQMLLHFRDSLPKGDLAERVALPLMRVLATHHIPTDEQLVYRFIVDITSLTDVLQQVWKESSLKVLLNCLQELFNIISAVDGPEPSVALGALVRLIPTQVVKSAISAVVQNARISDSAVKAALCRMIDWLVWPTCKNIDEWVICFLNQQAAAKKFSTLISVTEAKVEQVLDKVQYAPVREASFNILSHMLLSFQHSPHPFHKILQSVPATLALLEHESTEDSLRCRTRLAELLHCLMYLHAGFPDLYDPVLDLIKDVPCPSSEEINSRLSESRWTAQQCQTSATPQFSLLLKSETGKTGLFNLGNTCYMNSVLQSLFMCDDFRRRALQRTPTPEECLLDKLQYIFASLLLSQRPAIAPMKFLSASRPPWFTPGQQQDCSEFLKFLLDQVHEQELVANKKRSKASSPKRKESKMEIDSAGKEKMETEESEGATALWDGSVVDSEKDSTLVREWFGGKMRLTSRCLSCQQESHRVEDFIDISLAFPQAGNDNVALTSPPSLKALIGGGSHLPNSQVTTQPQDSAASMLKSPTPVSPPASDSPPPRATMHLTELLSHYLSAERMEGDNQYHCERCGKLQDGERTINIVRCPQYLILTLLRFNYDAKTQTRSKIFREVSCPRTLALPVQGPSSDGGVNSSTAAKRRKKLLHHLQPRLPSSVSSSPENCELYGLCSVVVHSGASSECGHYYCFSRHSQVDDVDAVISSLDKVGAVNSCSVDVGASSVCSGDGGATMEVPMPEEEMDIDFLQDKWCLFNDARVSSMNFSSFQNLGKRFQKDTPYVLVYRKLSLDSEDGQPSELPLRQGLRDAVNKDNSQYLKEQELAAKAKARRQRTSSTTTTTFTHWRDFDSDQGPPGSCGGGGGLDTSGARFVF